MQENKQNTYHLGKVHLKAEGAPIHPDDTDYNFPDHKSYMNQAKKYYEHHKLLDEWEGFKNHWKRLK